MGPAGPVRASVRLEQEAERCPGDRHVTGDQARPTAELSDACLCLCLRPRRLPADVGLPWCEAFSQPILPLAARPSVVPAVCQQDFPADSSHVSRTVLWFQPSWITTHFCSFKLQLRTEESKCDPQEQTLAAVLMPQNVV